MLTVPPSSLLRPPDEEGAAKGAAPGGGGDSGENPEWVVDGEAPDDWTWKMQWSQRTALRKEHVALASRQSDGEFFAEDEKYRSRRGVLKLDAEEGGIIAADLAEGSVAVVQRDGFVLALGFKGKKLFSEAI